MHTQFCSGNLKGRGHSENLENIIKIDLMEIMLECVTWTHLVQDRDKWRAFVNTAVNNSTKVGEFDWLIVGLRVGVGILYKFRLYFLIKTKNQCYCSYYCSSYSTISFITVLLHIFKTFSHSFLAARITDAASIGFKSKLSVVIQFYLTYFVL
jgi:hypothetical protein